MTAHRESKAALLVRGAAQEPGHVLIQRRLEVLGYVVEVKRDGEVADANAVEELIKGKELVVVSSLTGPSAVGAQLSGRQVPVIVADDDTLRTMGMVGQRVERAAAPGADALAGERAELEWSGYRKVGSEGARLRFTGYEHYLAAGNAGTVAAADLVAASAELHCSRPAPSAQVIAARSDDSGPAVDSTAADAEAVLFAYLGGAAMIERVAPARRVGFFIGGGQANLLTERGWELFDAAVEWAVGEELKRFEEVYREEWQEIRERRLRQRIDVDGSAARPDGTGAPAEAQRPPENLIGLALSGGGIRSATFSLGLLQGMDHSKLLRLFDYLSTVSGGGYIGGWWSAWLAREGFDAHNEHTYPLVNVTEIRPGRADDLVKKLLGRDESQSRDNDGNRDAGRAEERKYAKHVLLARYICDAALRESREKWEKFVAEYDPTGGAVDDIKSDLVQELNGLLAGECLIDRLLLLREDTARFPGHDFHRDFLDRITNPRLKRQIEAFHFERDANGRPILKVDEAGRPVSKEKVGADGKPVRGVLMQPRLCERSPGYDLTLFNRMLLEELFADEIGPDFFPPEEKIEPKRAALYTKTGGAGAGLTADGDRAGTRRRGAHGRLPEDLAESAGDVMCAGDDPVHHLRLFANYLTPRKGLLSADTWRAVLVVSRNLILTWMILLPVIVAAVLAGKLYFVTQPAVYEHVSAATSPLIASARLAAAGALSGLAAPPDDGVRAPAESVPALEPPPRTETVHQFVYPYRTVKAREDKALADKEGELAAAEGRLALAGSEEEAQPIREEIRGIKLAAAEISERAAAIDRERKESLRRRWLYLAWPLIGLAGWLIILAAVWKILNYAGRRELAWLGAAAVWTINGCLLAIFEPRWWTWMSGVLKFREDGWAVGVNREALAYNLGQVPVVVWALVALWAAVAGVLWRFAWRLPSENVRDAALLDPAARATARKEVQRNQTMRVNTQVLIVFVVAAVVLLLAGFGHELVEAAFRNRADMIEQAAGWAAIATAIASFAGALFTAVKASPAGGGDSRADATPSLPSRVIFALTPPLVLVVIALSAAWVAQQMIANVVYHPESVTEADRYEIFRHRIPPLTIINFAAVALCLSFGISELKWRAVSEASWKRQTAWSLLRWMVLLAVGAGLVFWLACLPIWPFGRLHRVAQRALPLALLVLTGCFLLLRLAVGADSGGTHLGRRHFHFLFGRRRADRGVSERELVRYGFAAAVVVAAVVALGFWAAPSGWLAEGLTPPRAAMSAVAVAGLTFCLGVVLLEIRRGTESHRRALWLIAASTGALGTILVVSFFSNFTLYPRLLLIHAALGWLGATLGWLIALGWMANPNALSMHLFYKSRLTRAYLGASNAERREQLVDVTEAVEGDDLCLATLKNCQRGGPYHLINTTLNMSAGRDLATAQRSSAMFVLSKRACGSSRTGYRSTARYMSGRMTLGTAVAVSGAAASPNMGSLTPSASLAMLMTLLNVRLGYWTPTPNKDLWRSPQAQLWPFYVLREFLSQTNDLASYCYLTDGGHFDNTGVYSLVERGCRYIVVADCGADPQPSFGDLGEVIRRCRIDFRANIKLSIEPFVERHEKGGVYFIVGEITYHKEHMRKLGWSPGKTDEEEREFERRRRGRILLFKPALGAEVSADVRQYGIENPVFPQQSTADQWFDESQFESYRQLGYLCARKLTDRLGEVFHPVKNERPLKCDAVDKIFDEIFEKFRPREFESPLMKSLEEVMNREAEQLRLNLTQGCRYYLLKTIADGAARLREMDNFSQQAKEAKANFIWLMQQLKEHVRAEYVNGGDGAAAAAAADEDKEYELHERAFFAVTRRLTLFPFFEQEERAPNDESASNGHKRGDPKSNGRG